jgi:hypothetical protein
MSSRTVPALRRGTRQRNVREGESHHLFQAAGAEAYRAFHLSPSGGPGGRVRLGNLYSEKCPRMCGHNDVPRVIKAQPFRGNDRERGQIIVTAPRPSLKSPQTGHGPGIQGSVIAPRSAPATRVAYFASTPVV